MKSPEEIKRALRICAGGYCKCDGCNKCPYIEKTNCNDALMLDVLSFIKKLEERIRQLEATPINSDNNLPRGWVEMNNDSEGGKIVMDASKIISVEEGNAVQRRIVRLMGGNYVFVRETIPEVLAKIREVME